MNNERLSFEVVGFFKIALAFYLGFVRERSKDFFSSKMSQRAMQPVPSTGLIGLRYTRMLSFTFAHFTGVW